MVELDVSLVTLPLDDCLAAFALRICSRKAADDLAPLDGDFGSLLVIVVFEEDDLTGGRGVVSPCEDAVGFILTVREVEVLGVAEGRETSFAGTDFCEVADTLAPDVLPRVFTLVEDESALPAVVLFARDLGGFLRVPVLVGGIGGISGTIESPSREPGRLV
jgi:hypothetical protein